MTGRPGRTARQTTATDRTRRCVAAAIALVLAAGSLAAQTVPTGVQEYFVLGWEQHMWDMMDRVVDAEGSGPLASGMNSVVTATASADNQVIYYDHWEDGLDPGLVDFPDTIGALQSTTLVIGDGVPGNGDVCTYNVNIPCGTDLIVVGDYVNFNSDQGLGGTCASLPADPEKCSVPLNPRCAADPCTAAEIRYDGGDLVKTTGGPLSLIHNQWPMTQYIGGATEILPRQAVEAARSYSVPIGEDLFVNGTVTEPFQYVELELVAFEDTGVTVESPGAGSVSFTLTRGQHWSSMGAIDEVPEPTLELTINSGSKVSTTAPIAGMIFTGGEGTWATRHFALLPDILHSTDYVTTAPGDDPATNGDRPANIYILNPDQLSSIDVAITDNTGSYSVNIPPNSMRSMQDIPPGQGGGRDIAFDSTVRITSDHTFWGITAYDYGSPSNDWGHSWLAKKFLTLAYTIGHAPQNSDIANQAELYNPVYVAATQDNTLVNFDLDNDGTFDQVDITGDGVADDDLSTPDNSYRLDTPSALLAFKPTLVITAPREMTGTRIIANKPIAVSWGQETDLAPGGSFGLDTGYTVYPVQQAFLDPALTLEKVADTSVVPIAPVDADDRIVTYTITIESYDFGPLTDAEVWDLLPVGVAGSDYVPNSTLITYPDLTPDTVEPTASIDPLSGRHRLDWPLTSDPPYDPGDPAFSFGTNQVLTVTYQVRIPEAPGGVPRRLLNRGNALAYLGGSVFSPTDIEAVVQTDVELMKAVDVTNPGPGDVLTYTLTVINNGSTDELNAVVSDAIPPNTTYCDTTTDPGVCLDPTGDPPFGAGVFNPSQNTVIWGPATLVAGQGATLTFQVKVNPQTPAGTLIPNQAGYECDITPYFLSNEVVSIVEGPKLEAVKSAVGSPSIVHPLEPITFEVEVTNTGSGIADNVVVVDPFPANTTYVAGSMEWSLNTGPFVSLTDADDGDEGGGAEGIAYPDRVELLLASLGSSQDLRLRFVVQANPGTAGLFVANQAVYGSTEIPSADTNLVQIPIVGDSEITGHVFLDLDGNGTQDPGEPDLADIDVVVTDPTGAQQRVTTDSNGDYIATVVLISSPLGCYLDQVSAAAYNGSDGTLNWALTPWAEFGNGADGNVATNPMLVAGDPQSVPGNNTLRIQGVGGTTLPADTRGFTRAADLDPGNTATLTFRYFRLDFESDDEVSLEIDYGSGFTAVAGGVFGQPAGGVENDTQWQAASFNLDSTQLPADPVTLRLRTTGGFAFANDEFYFDDVELCATSVTDADVTVDVDETDPDFPAGATLTTANDPQTVVAVPGGTAAATDVGYQQDELIFTKTSDSIGGEVSPGQTVTYTLEITNNTGATQTGIDVDDPLPTGTTYVPGSTQVTGAGSNVVRVTEYYLAPGAFSGTVYDLSLNQDLVADYFVILQGSDGDTANGGRGPDENYAALVQDPFATGQLGASTGSSVIRLQRGAAINSWVGVVTVVECLTDCDTRGFNLLDVQVVNHTGTSTTGSATSTPAWTDLSRVLLMGGFNGAGCVTSEASVNATKVCHARIFPSGTDQINWTRDPNDVTLTTAASTVMVIQWGSEWTVQRVRVQGNNGGDGADAVGEYNTAAISPVARANTWVWGTGHTAVEGIGEAAEGSLITLGDGVNEIASETQVAVANEYALLSTDFEVYALTHPDLVVDQFFKVDGDVNALTVDVLVAAAGSQRMALSYNGQNGTGTAYPRPFLSARYLDATTVRLERRRSGQEFPAWVQGVDFSGLAPLSPPGGGVPPNLVVPSDGYSLVPGATMTVTFQVLVDDPLAGGITQIQNDAELNTAQPLGPLYASVTDDVVRAGVVIEYDNSGFGEATVSPMAPSTVSYAHVVENTGEGDDSYDITPSSREGWPVQLVDPSTGSVVATDSDGDGVWDGGVTINTGTLAPGQTIDYLLRVTIPNGVTAGGSESTGLRATSDRNPGRFDIATDETTAVANLEPVIFLPDNSGVASAGSFTAYSHRVLNNTGATETFFLEATSELGWTTTFYWDTNGDGVYTPGVDIAITNTRQLAQGESQLIFAVVGVPGGTGDFTTDVVHLTAAAQSDPDNVFSTVTDTTTVRPPIIMDLSGGGTQTGTPDATSVFPGVLRNFANAADRFNLDITASWFFGEDSLLHPTELWIDTDSDDIPDTLIATDTDGDGTWDSITDGYDTEMDGEPDVAIAAGSELYYDLRRYIDPLMGPSRDPVTLTAISFNSPLPVKERDSVTATVLLAAATKALLASFDAYGDGGRVVVEWRTAVEMGTAGFDLWRRRAGSAEYERVNPTLIPGVLTALQGGTYRYVDRGATIGTTVDYLLEEKELRGGGQTFGPFTVTPEVRRSDAKSAELLASGSFRAANTSSVRTPRATAALKVSSQDPSGLVKILVRENGLVWVSAAELAEAFGADPGTVAGWIAGGDLWINTGSGSGPASLGIFADGFETGDSDRWATGGEVPDEQDPATGVAWIASADNGGLYFYGEAIESPYTDDNVYWLGHGRGAQIDGQPASPGNQIPLTAFNQHIHFEEDLWPLTSVITDPEGDFWMWDYFFSNTPGDDVRTLTLTTPGVAGGEGDAGMTLFLQGASVDAIEPNHNIEVRLNGNQLGDVHSWNGDDVLQLDLSFPQSLLNDGDNTLEITALAVPGLEYDVFYLDAVEVSYRRLFIAEDDRLEARVESGGVVEVSGFGTDDISVFDLTEPTQPVLLEGAEISGAPGDFSVRFAAASGLEFLATTSAASLPPSGMISDLASDLAAADNRGRWVVVAGPGLEGAAAEFADYRAAQGMSTVVARVADIYDEFSGGLTTPWAIRDFLQHASENWLEPPEYVFLAGDGSLDYKNFDGLGESLVPAPFTVTDDGLVPADNLLGDWIGNDGVPEVAIGRLPAQSASELEDYRAKVESFEASFGDWKHHTLWLADDPDVGGEFGDDAEELIDGLPDDYTVQRVFLDPDDIDNAWESTIQAMSEGALLVNFLGHGGLDRLASEGLLETDDVALIANQERASFVVALTCIVGRFDIPNYDTLAEALLVKQDGGAVAVWSPSAYSMNAGARDLGRHHLGAISSGDFTTVGDSVRAALAAYFADPEGDPELPARFILLGDPAIRVDW